MLDKNDIKYFKMAVGLDNIGKSSDVDIAARCPVCGDSRKNKRMKRLHLYKKGTVTNVSCFNGDCAVHNKTVYSFLRDFYPSLLPNYKRETFGDTMKKLADGGDVFGNFKKPEKVEKKSEVVTQDLSMYMTDIADAPEALAYLENRGIQYDGSHGKWYFGHQDLQIGDVLYKITGAIIIPLYYNNEMYGFYSRSIHDKTFYTYMHDANIGYKLSFWFDIDKSKDCLIAEGIFDCLSINYPNKIATMGAKLADARLAELKRPVFVLDNDKTGLLNSLEYAKRRHRVYIQPDCYHEKDMNELKLNHPDLDIYAMISENTFSGIAAEIRIKAKL